MPDERVLAIGGLAGKVVRIALDQGFARAQEAVAEEELGRLARCLAEELGMAGIHRAKSVKVCHCARAGGPSAATETRVTDRRNGRRST